MTILLFPVCRGIQQFEETPQYTEVNPGQDAKLICRVLGKRGQCIWQKDQKVSCTLKWFIYGPWRIYSYRADRWGVYPSNPVARGFNSIPVRFDFHRIHFWNKMDRSKLYVGTYVWLAQSLILSLPAFETSKWRKREAHENWKEWAKWRGKERERREGNKRKQKDKNMGRVIDNLKNKRLLKEDWKKKTRMDERNFHSRILTIKYGESIRGWSG